MLETNEAKDRFDIFSLDESKFPQFTLAKNKARFLRMVAKGTLFAPKAQDQLRVATMDMAGLRTPSLTGSPAG